MDSEEPWDSYIDPYAWVAALFMFMTCCGGAILCCHAGYIRRDGTVIIVGRPWNAANNNTNLMTRQQVLDLPEVVFSVDSKGCQDIQDETRSNSVLDDLSEPLLKSIPADSVSSNSNKKKSLSDSSLAQTSTGFEWNSSCSICLDEYELGEKLRVLPCRHMFHTDCILPWLTERQGLCPLCKYQVLPDNDEEANEEANSPGIEMDQVGIFSRPVSPTEEGENLSGNFQDEQIESSNRRTRVMHWLSMSSNRRRNRRRDSHATDTELGEELNTPLLNNQREGDGNGSPTEIMSV